MRWQVCSDSTSCTKLTMESFNQRKIDEAREFFRSLLPPGSVLEIHDEELLEYAADRIARLLSADESALAPCEKAIKAPIEEAMKVIVVFLKVTFGWNFRDRIFSSLFWGDFGRCFFFLKRKRTKLPVFGMEMRISCGIERSHDRTSLLFVSTVL